LWGIVVTSVAKLGDNTLAPSSVDVSGLQLDQGKHESMTLGAQVGLQ
jgi:hypothetical protein